MGGKGGGMGGEGGRIGGEREMEEWEGRWRNGR